MRVSNNTGLAFVAALAMSLSAPAATLIDNFDLPTPASGFQILNGPNPTTVVTDIGGGTNRTATVGVTGGTLQFGSLFGGIGGGAFVANFSNFVNGYANLNYAFGSLQDFATGNDGLVLAGMASSNGAVPINIALSVGTTGGTFTLNGTLSQSLTATTWFFRFSDFSGTGNWSQVNSLSANVTAPAGTSLFLDEITAAPAPEPATALSLLLALPAIAALRRKA